MKKQGCVEYCQTLLLCCIIILFVPKIWFFILTLTSSSDLSLHSPPWVHQTLKDALSKTETEPTGGIINTAGNQHFWNFYAPSKKRFCKNLICCHVNDGLLINIFSRDEVGVLVKKAFMNFYGEWKMKAWIYFWEDCVQLMPCLEKWSFWKFV